MTDKIYATLMAEAFASSDRETYISDWALSSIWGGAEDAGIPQARIAALGDIWDVAHLSIKDIRKASGMSQVAFAQHVCIPRRSIEDWERGVRTCPDYLRVLLAEHFGLFHRPEDC